jgi:hypothetical protein
MTTRSKAFYALIIPVLLALGSVGAHAHCDAVDGPVVQDAQAALASGDLTPVLKWVSEEDEGEVQEAFRQTLVVREQGVEAHDLADRYFFETVVRLHRKSEGAPYTGLKPAGTDPGPSVSAADRALESGSADALVALVTGDVARELRASFDRTREAKRRSGESVEAGRDYVRAYAHFVHLAKGIHDAAVGAEAAHDVAPAGL